MILSAKVIKMKKHYDARIAISVRAVIVPCLGSLFCVISYLKCRDLKQYLFLAYTSVCGLESARKLLLGFI